MERLLVAIIDAALAAGVVKRAWRTAMRVLGKCDVRREIERLKTSRRPRHRSQDRQSS